MRHDAGHARAEIDWFLSEAVTKSKQVIATMDSDELKRDAYKFLLRRLRDVTKKVENDCDE